MTDGRGQPIGGIELWRQRIGLQDRLQHGRYLFLGRATISSDGLLDPLGGVLHIRDIPTEGSSYGHALGAPELEHALYVLAEELGLYRHLIGTVLIDQLYEAVIDALESLAVLIVLVELDAACSEHTHLASLHQDEAIAQHGGTGVYPQDDTFLLHGLLHSSQR